jgi:hypothetical protein
MPSNKAKSINPAVSYTFSAIGKSLKFLQISYRTEPLRGKCSPAGWILPTDIF